MSQRLLTCTERCSFINTPLMAELGSSGGAGNEGRFSAERPFSMTAGALLSGVLEVLDRVLAGAMPALTALPAQEIPCVHCGQLSAIAEAPIIDSALPVSAGTHVPFPKPLTGQVARDWAPGSLLRLRWRSILELLLDAPKIVSGKRCEHRINPYRGHLLAALFHFVSRFSFEWAMPAQTGSFPRVRDASEPASAQFAVARLNRLRRPGTGAPPGRCATDRFAARQIPQFTYR